MESDASSSSVTLGLVFLSFANHMLVFLLGQMNLVVRDGDSIRFTSCLVGGRDVEDTVGVDVERNLNLGNATGCGWNT